MYCRTVYTCKVLCGASIYSSMQGEEEVTLKVGSDLDTPGMEVVVETGPVCNLGDEVIESGTYYDDEDDDVNVDGYYDDMAYPGDPLLNSDGEDDDEGLNTDGWCLVVHSLYLSDQCRVLAGKTHFEMNKLESIRIWTFHCFC